MPVRSQLEREASLAGSTCLRDPRVASQIDASPWIELDAFLLEQLPLHLIEAGLGSGAHFTPCIDDPLPRNRKPLRHRVHRVPDLTRPPRQAR
jgi:hypothetical protein